MKTFKYRWKMGNSEMVDARDFEDRNHLETHVKNIGGELIEILEEVEKVKESSSHNVSSNSLNTKKCPFCREEIRAEAIKCKHCGEMLNRYQSPKHNIGYEDPCRPPRGGNNGLAITSFVLGISAVITSAVGIGFLFAVIAVCLGPGGRNSKYNTLAIWGICLGWIVIILSILTWIFLGALLIAWIRSLWGIFPYPFRDIVLALQPISSAIF